MKRKNKHLHKKKNNSDSVTMAEGNVAACGEDIPWVGGKLQVFFFVFFLINVLSYKY